MSELTDSLTDSGAHSDEGVNGNIFTSKLLLHY